MKRSHIATLGSGLFLVGILAAPVARADQYDRSDKLDTGAEKSQKLDRNNDGEVSQMELERYSHDKYQELDKNDDGTVTLSEWKAIRDKGKIVGIEGASETESFKRVDKNGDGKITEDEFLAAEQGWFDKRDKDKSGTLSKSEMGSSGSTGY